MVRGSFGIWEPWNITLLDAMFRANISTMQVLHAEAPLHKRTNDRAFLCPVFQIHFITFYHLHWNSAWWPKLVLCFTEIRQNVYFWPLTLLSLVHYSTGMSKKTSARLLGGLGGDSIKFWKVFRIRKYFQNPFQNTFREHPGPWFNQLPKILPKILPKTLPKSKYSTAQKAIDAGNLLI